MTAPLLSMTVIAKDEAKTIGRFLDSCWDACDEVVIVDTGSTDGTLGEAQRYAKRKKDGYKLKTATFKWCDDFSAARNYADSLATGAWTAWGDCDDTIEGLDVIRGFAQEAPPDVLAFFAVYDYARDDHGNCLSELWRERVVRRGLSKWEGRLHEHKLFQGGTVVKVDPAQARWVHHREIGVPSERNLRILTQWDKDEPNTPRVLSSIGLEHMGLQQPREAADAFARYLQCEGEPKDRRAQAARYLSVMLIQQGRIDEAKQAALQSLSEYALWPDTYLSLAECAQIQGDPQAGYHYAKTALEMGKPDSLLILNPIQYTVHPRSVMAICAAQMSRLDEALKLAGEALAECPSYQPLAANVGLWQATMKREQTASAFIHCAHLLIDHDELEKAHRVLDAVPFFAQDHPAVVERRAHVNRLLSDARRADPEPVEDNAAGLFLLNQLERYDHQEVAA